VITLGSANIKETAVRNDDTVNLFSSREGIENAVQLHQLLQMGCAAGQGLHLSPPLAAESIDGLLDGLGAKAPAAAAARPFVPATVLH
jgi:predicted signal transduction protein with EAL and GGDEF domain